MSYVFTTEQQQELSALIIAIESDENRDYAEVYQLIAEILFEPQLLPYDGSIPSYGPSLADQDPAIMEVALWFAGAAQVNAGEGAFSVLIREYTRYQLQLRDPNWSNLSDEEQKQLIQDASDQVAKNAIEDILEDWTLPTLNQIAFSDAVGTGQILFDFLAETDSAHPNAQNSAWSGALLFSLLDVNEDGESGEQSWRLLGNLEDGQFSTFEDFRDVTFAALSFIHAFNEINISDLFDGADDIYVALRTAYEDSFFSFPEAEQVLENMLGGDDAEGAVKFALDNGPANLISQLASLYGHDIDPSSSPDQLAQQAQSFFLWLDTENLLTMEFSPIILDNSLVGLAMQDSADGMAYRYALQNLVPFVVLNTDVYGAHNYKR